MSSFEERLKALGKRAKQEKEDRLNEMRSAYEQVQSLCITAMESCENLMDGVTVLIPKKLIWNAFQLNDEVMFKHKLQSMLEGKFSVIFRETQSDSEHWAYHIYYQ